eukprot:jgi/Botrbrau1/13679/Bobra.0378s0010.1
MDSKGSVSNAKVVDQLASLFSSPPVSKSGGTSIPKHPLDPLTIEEVAAFTEAIKAHAEKLGIGPIRFNFVTAKEPSKADILAYEADRLGRVVLPRVAFGVVQLPYGANVVEVTANLAGGSVSIVSWVQLEGIQPMVTVDDCLDAEDICKADEKFRRVIKERYGIVDLDLVACDPWYYGDRYMYAEDPMPDGRIMQCFVYSRSRLGDNHYAHPLDLLVYLDMSSKKVLEILGHSKPAVIPALDANFFVPHVVKERGVRTDLKPLNIVQPEGPSFKVDGYRVTWQKWNFRVGFNYREGLTLHDIGYEDGGRIRPVVHRASLVEIIVPYGDPRAPFHKKCAFDVVDYGLGSSCGSLDLGCDCLGYIHYFDGVLVSKDGEPMVIKNAVCLHEEDVGILWKHMEYRNGHNESRRSRRLVVSFVATIANYEYGFYWYFYQDGTIQQEAKLTGCLSTNVLSEGEGPLPTHGVLMAPGLNAQIHQHFFCARLDMAVDDPNGGQGLSVVEINCESMPVGPDNPYGVGFVALETVLETEKQAQRTIDPYKSRCWKVVNYNSRNRVTGSPVAWKLIPGSLPPVYAAPTSEHAKRGAFATKHLWVTPHSDDEIFPAGMYPLEPNPIGIVEWTANDRPVKNADVVLWHSFGVTHIPRIEDYPVMPVEMVGFQLKPFNFFDVNPGLDIPGAPNAASVRVNKDGCDDCTPSPAAKAIGGTSVEIRSPQHSGREVEHSILASTRMPLSKI